MVAVIALSLFGKGVVEVGENVAPGGEVGPKGERGDAGSLDADDAQDNLPWLSHIRVSVQKGSAVAKADTNPSSVQGGHGGCVAHVVRRGNLEGHDMSVVARARAVNAGKAECALRALRALHDLRAERRQSIALNELVKDVVVVVVEKFLAHRGLAVRVQQDLVGQSRQSDRNHLQSLETAAARGTEIVLETKRRYRVDLPVQEMNGDDGVVLEESEGFLEGQEKVQVGRDGLDHHVVASFVGGGSGDVLGARHVIESTLVCGGRLGRGPIAVAVVVIAVAVFTKGE